MSGPSEGFVSRRDSTPSPVPMQTASPASPATSAAAAVVAAHAAASGVAAAAVMVATPGGGGGGVDPPLASTSSSSSPHMMPPSPVSRETLQMQKRIESLQQQNKVLKCELETYKLRVKSLQEENRAIRQASVHIVSFQCHCHYHSLPKMVHKDLFFNQLSRSWRKLT